jgi:ring-1,2-phenylacetyl-CoA epoxidase subunit PaaA
VADTANARSLSLTVLGDLVLPARGEAWLGALTEVMALLGVPPDATREGLRALADENLVQPRQVGKLAAYRLTAVGRRRLEEAAERIYLRSPRDWDGKWRLLSFHIPQRSQASRAALERELGWLGYGRLDSGLWVCPWDLGARLDAVLAKHDVTGSVESFTSEHHQGDDRALVREAYDLEALRDAHGAFIRRFGAELAELSGNRDGLGDALGDAEALARRLRLVHAWRKFLFSDPGLPVELTPRDWLGVQATDVFRRLYRLYEQPGWRAWDRIVARADPDGVAPWHPRSNLDRVLPAAQASGRAALERRTEEFRQRIAAGRRVEASWWMPEEYRKVALRFIEMHANSELMGALPEREWIARAPTLRRKRSLAAKVQDEVGHSHLIYRVAQDLGKSREQMFEDLIAGRTKFHNVFHYPAETWGDVAVIGFLVDGAAIVTQRALLDTSYGPYQRVMRRVVAEESLHYRHGEDITLELASGTQEQFEMLQDAVNRWWEPIMHFFGHNTPREQDVPLQWGIKSRTNEESRQEFFGQYVPKMWDMGIEIPDSGLRYDAEEKLWRYSEPDWEKMNAIIRGEGPMTQTRLAWRRWMRESHAWLRVVMTGEPAGA